MGGAEWGNLPLALGCTESVSAMPRVVYRASGAQQTRRDAEMRPIQEEMSTAMLAAPCSERDLQSAKPEPSRPPDRSLIASAAARASLPESRAAQQQSAAMNKLLFADSAGPAWQKMYNNTHFALAALLPASLVSPQDGAIAKVADVGLAAAITAHNHVALNYGAPRRGGRQGGGRRAGAGGGRAPTCSAASWLCLRSCRVQAWLCRSSRECRSGCKRSHAATAVQPWCPASHAAGGRAFDRPGCVLLRSSAASAASLPPSPQPAAVISDYIPRGIQVPVRGAVVGLSVLTALGLTKLALTGARAAGRCWAPRRRLAGSLRAA